jgi:hypothetical protein
VDLRTWLKRAVAWKAKAVGIRTPALPQGQSYHLEVEAPEGLKLTRGRLKPQGDGRDTARVRAVTRNVQRLHLYASQVPPRTGGGALVNLRPTPSTMVRAASITAFLTTGFLTLVALRWEAMVANLGPLVSMLLLVPGGMAA